MADKLKKSRYAIFLEKEDGSYIAYSTLSGAIIVFTEPSYINRLKKIISQEVIINNSNDDIIYMLKSKNFYISTFSDENLLVRNMYEESIVRSSLLDLMLIVTRQCNFRCTYCGQPHKNKVMNAETYRAIIKFVRNQISMRGYRKVRVTFFGGEPLLEFDNIITFLSDLRDMLSSEFQDIQYEAGMSTNAYLLSPERFNALADLNCNFYQISIDGMDYTHDKTRPLINGKGTWQTIIDNMKYMITTDKTFKISLRTNYNADVADSLINFYKYVNENLNDKRISIYYETIKNQGNDKTPTILSEVEGLLLNIEIIGIIKEQNLSCINVSSRNMPCSRVCYASKPNYFIFDERKQILKCSFALDDKNNCIGLLKNDGTYDCNNEIYSQWVYSDYLTSSKCKECLALPLCFGKRCPKTRIAYGDMNCNLEIIESELEETIRKYY